MRRVGDVRKIFLYLLLTFSIFKFIIPRFFNSNTVCRREEADDNERKVASVINSFRKDILKNGTINEQKFQLSSQDHNMFRGYDDLSLSDLENNFIPNHIYYVWCYNRTIEFRQYLSIMAAWKIMRPDSITFFTKFHISDEDEHYNFWLSDLKKSISGFKVQKIPQSWDGQEKGCGIWFAFAVLDDVGGIYFSENLFLLKSLRFIRKNKFSVATTIDIKDVSFIASTPRNERLKHFKKLYENISVNAPLVPGLLFCDTLDNIHKAKLGSTPLCTHMGNVFPVEIMHLNSTFGRLARKILYGHSEEVKAQPLLPGFIPKIFHMVWFGHKVMDFTMYLCLKSILTIVKPDKVYIHGDGLLHGKYLDEFKRDTRLVFINREVPDHIFGHRILYMQHRSDIIRADVLLRYGGIYSDWDVLWLKPIDDLIEKQYDTILNFDHMPRPGYPDSINLGVLMSKPGANFVKHWQDFLVNYRSRDFYFNAIELPYKTFEKYPETVHIERHLQVMCYYLKCHPTFHPQYRNFNEAQPFNWTTDAYSIHFTHPDPPAYANETALKNSKGMFTDIANFILAQPP